MKKPEKMNYFRRLIDDKDPASAKRFLGLAMSAFLIIAFFILLFTKVENANTNLLDRALLYAFCIVLMSLFGLAVDKVAEIALSVSKTQAAAKVLTPPPTVTKVDNVQGDITGGSTAATTTLPGDDILEDNDMKEIKKNLTKSLKEPE